MIRNRSKCYWAVTDFFVIIKIVLLIAFGDCDNDAIV